MSLYIQVTYNVAAASKNNMCTFVSKLDPELSGLQEGIRTARQQGDKLSYLLYYYKSINTDAEGDADALADLLTRLRCAQVLKPQNNRETNSL